MDGKNQNAKGNNTKQNTKNTIQAAEKGFGAAFGGRAGIKAVNAAHNIPIAGKALNKTENVLADKLSRNKMVGAAANGLGKSGVTKAANKGLDAAGGSSAKNKNSNNNKNNDDNKEKTSQPMESAIPNKNISNTKTSGSQSKSSAMGNIASSLAGGSSLKESTKQEAFQQIKKKVIMKYAIPVIIGAAGFFLLLIAIFGVSYYFNNIIDTAKEWVEKGKNNVTSFFEKFDNFLRGNGWADDETAFLNSLNNKTEYYSKRGLQINVPLIMSTLMTRQLYTSDNLEDDMGEEFADIDETQTDVNEIRFGSMIGDMRKLAEYQVVKFFSLPSDDDPSVYSTVINPPLAVLNGFANLLNVAADTLFPSNMKLSNANYLSNLRFGKSADKDVIDSENSNYSTSVGTSSGDIRLTNFIDDVVGWNSMSPYGYLSERFRLNEKGWWMYKDPDSGIEYLAVAAPTVYGLQGAWGTHYEQYNEITYYEYGDIIPLNIAGENYQAMVIDSCGACMTATNPIKIDVYVSKDYFSESGITAAGTAAGAVMPDELTTTMGTIQNKPTQEFWQYVKPTDEEKQDIQGYKNGYIYKAYSDVFKDIPDEAIPSKVESIIRTIYESKDQYIEYSSAINGDSGGADVIEGERTSRPSRNNAFYYDQTTDSGANGTLEGECAWYATGRAKEFLASINSSETWTGYTDGGKFCDLDDAQKFNMGSTPKAGSLVSWTRGQYGHVAFVESVNADGTFNITEAGISFGQWGKSARSVINSGSNNAQLRKENCEGNGTGCFNTQKNITTSAYSNFKCFIYLTEPKNGGNTNE